MGFVENVNLAANNIVVITIVNDNIDGINLLADSISDGSLDKVIAITEAEVATGEPGTEVTWDGSLLTIPRGDSGLDGLNGDNGLTPNYEFSYNDLTGDLEYSFIGYTYETAPSIEEII